MSPFLRFRSTAVSAARFRGNQRGSAAVEFALVAPLFFALLFAIIETGLVFFASQSLETALQDSARAIMTGQAQISNLTKQSFKANIVCKYAGSLFDCENGICRCPELSLRFRERDDLRSDLGRKLRR